MPSRSFRTVLLASAALSACLTAGLQSRPVTAPSAPAARAAPDGTFRVMTLNLAHGRGLAFHQVLTADATIEDNLTAVSALVAGHRPDVVALQEADGASTWSGGFDHVARIAAATGMGHVYRGRHAQLSTLGVEIDYGTALVTQAPMTDPVSQAFDTSWRDTKGFVVASVVPNGSVQAVDVVSVHLDFLSEDVRRQQLDALIDTLEQRARPSVVLGDLNCEWSTCARYLARALDLRAWRPSEQQPTFPADGPDRRIDWVLVSPELEVADHWVVDATVSDHRAVVADIRWRSRAG